MLYMHFNEKLLGLKEVTIKNVEEDGEENFDLVQYGKPRLPKVLAIDKFKGNTDGEKYQCILTDPKTHIVLDILPKRYSNYLIDYFKSIDRSNVKYFVSDMWRTYSDFAAAFLKNATPVIDKYHFIRQVTWAFEAVKKEEQKKFSKDHRKYFKRSKRLLTKRYDKLTEEQRQQVDVMLYSSANLSSAHFLKELFYRILDNRDKETAKKAMSELILEAQNSNIPVFAACAKRLLIDPLEYLTRLIVHIQTALPRAATTRLKS